jgi:8-oxo-(d)GTP phosphatase
MIRDLAPTIRDHARRLLPAGSDDDKAATGTTTLLVVRHGHAGDREKWEGADEKRPLSKKGRRQAGGLVEVLADFEVGRILSSRFVRCLETVVPLACDRDRSIEVHPALAEGASALQVSALVAELTGTTTVLCTHGDVLWKLVVDLAHHPATGEEDLSMAKGSTWVVSGEGGRLSADRYLPPAKN